MTVVKSNYKKFGSAREVSLEAAIAKFQGSSSNCSSCREGNPPPCFFGECPRVKKKWDRKKPDSE